jgi:uncharacterized protein YjiS (DUF1127 family)
MTMVHYRSVPRLARPTLAMWRLLRLVALLGNWRKRARQRRELADLSVAQLRDVGLNRHAIQREVQKPFLIG